MTPFLTVRILDLNEKKGQAQSQHCTANQTKHVKDDILGFLLRSRKTQGLGILLGKRCRPTATAVI